MKMRRFGQRNIGQISSQKFPLRNGCSLLKILGHPVLVPLQALLEVPLNLPLETLVHRSLATTLCLLTDIPPAMTTRRIPKVHDPISVSGSESLDVCSLATYTFFVLDFWSGSCLSFFFLGLDSRAACLLFVFGLGLCLWGFMAVQISHPQSSC
ncbi:uncharacterized protein BDR25DRAFT_106611 [Lindgomyces ingoldianus]|uniref:Uncharacterized protein n=1 Tax=Lindgomyces ingoldianus TaxID=673940 RepID=A0ACB6QBF3_9PLEO|nr:uncharacterized protein BDR25DRAFT_106611 [Lindgomyces ingoldianus]KAF2463707.1 hypothetical protein BDR25DRAFT_106611 [Lindgomyces ingoldianus]